MKKRNELQKQLGSRYAFQPFFSESEVRKLQKENPLGFKLQTAAVLVAGCVKIEITLYRQNGKIQTGYDVFVKEDSKSTEWICYDSPDDAVSFKEIDMLYVLDRVVRKNGLSYTDCCFEKLDGKMIKVKKHKID